MMGYNGQTPTIQTYTSGSCTTTLCKTTTTYAFDGSINTAPSTTKTPSPTSGTGQEYNNGVLGDTLYLKDYLLVGNVYKTDTTTYGSTGLIAYRVNSTSSKAIYWLASRYFEYSDEVDFYFYVRGIRTNGSLVPYELRCFEDDWSDYSSGRAVRPIITLKSGVTISGGSGTKASPYTLS